MREVSPGDLVFSFVDTRIIAIGVAASNCYENPKPSGFGDVGMYWDTIGGKIRVNFVEMRSKIRPKDHMGVLRGALPDKYSPLQESSNGNQGIYLTELSKALAALLIGLIGAEARGIAQTIEQATDIVRPATETADLEIWEHHIEQTIEATPNLTNTEREALIVARRRQGKFKEHVMAIERSCGVTGVDIIHVLRAHAYPRIRVEV